MEKETLTEFGATFHYKVFLGKMSDGGYVTIEEFIDGLLSMSTTIGTFALRMMSCMTRLSVLHISHMKSHRESS